MMAALATVQYFQGLRISEAAAIHHDDVKLDDNSPQNSRLLITRSIIWPRKKDLRSYLSNGFKNAEANEGLKEQPLFPEAYYAIKEVWSEDRGQLFHINGEILEYRQIQHAYDSAFKLAELPYRGTHVMRHGGTRFVYNSTKDLDVAKQFLGNRDMQTVAIYAQRDASALTDFSNLLWEKNLGGLQRAAND